MEYLERETEAFKENGAVTVMTEGLSDLPNDPSFSLENISKF